MRLPAGVLLVPIRPGVEMLMPALLPVTVHPAVIAEFGSVLELVLSYVCDVTFARGVAFYGIPRQWIMAMAEPHKAAKAHDRVADGT
jgi:hypothetical protein